MDTRLNIPDFKQAFIDAFGISPRVFRSPGRINLIGEHTDYNEGFVMPAAIDRHVYVAISPRTDDLVRIASTDFPGMHEGSVTDTGRAALGWPDYALGMLAAFRDRGVTPKGFNMMVGSDLPVGAGVSSSAAFSCAVGFAFNEIFHAGLERFEIIRMAQWAEHNYAGVMCGIMDPFASMMGKEGHFIRLDCRSLDYQYITLNAQGVSLLLLNTNVKHSLASSAYNRRREECLMGVSWVKERYPQVNSLRDVTEKMLDECVAPRDPLVDSRCRYVVQENERLIGLCGDIERGDMVAAGEKLYLTHDGLSRMYEVSCPELDYLVDQVRGRSGVFGARMMGGGFGGCTINLVSTDIIAELVGALSAAYTETHGKPLTAIAVSTGDGTSELPC